MILTFGDIVIVGDGLLGVIVKSWETKDGVVHEVYVRDFNGIIEYYERDIRRYLVRHKEMSQEEMEYQFNAEMTGKPNSEINSDKRSK